jgi:hypothetical protein
MPIMCVAAAAAGLHVDFLDDLYELGFDNDAAIPLLWGGVCHPPPPPPPTFGRSELTPILYQSYYLSPRCRTRHDAVAASAPAAAAVRFLSTCLLLHAVKFTGKARVAEAWRAVAAAGISQQQLQDAKVQFCFSSCVSLLNDSFGFTLKEVREMTGATVKMLLIDELRLFPMVREGESYGSYYKHFGECKLAQLSDFISAGYAEAEVRDAVREIHVVPVFERRGCNYRKI